jgi:hypothetical protein
MKLLDAVVVVAAAAWVGPVLVRETVLMVGCLFCL